MKYEKNYETYNDSLLSPEPMQEKETDTSETDYDNPDPPEEEQEFKKHRKDLTTELFKLIETSFKP